MRQAHEFRTVAMDTWITLQVVSSWPRERVEVDAKRAFDWFEAVEKACSRFDPSSELRRLVDRPGEPVPVSPLLLEATAFALELARMTNGAFDPTVGGALERRGFNRNYRTGEAVPSGVDDAGASYEDVRIDRRNRSITLRRPLLLDLGAVAKGLAVDLAAQTLASYDGFSVDAGGDVYAHGHNAAGASWRIGIQHPRAEGLLVRTIEMTDGAVCTSGDYERRSPEGGTHVIDARGKQPVERLASVTVLAPTAMAADGLSTAAMILGPERGIALLEDQGVSGLLLAADGTEYRTRAGFGADLWR